MVSIFGLVIDDEATREQLVTAIAEAVPPLEEFARAAFESVSAGAVPTGIIAVLGLLWGSSRFYAALDYAFTRIFQDGRKRNEIERTRPGRHRHVPPGGRPAGGAGPRRGDRLAGAGRRATSPGSLLQLASPVGPRSCCS